MSTRALIEFWDDGEAAARVYRHSDGYPDGPHGVLADLQRLFSDIERDTKDTRFRDPNYLAAKYVVWESQQCKRGDGLLDFLGVGVVLSDDCGQAYTYRVRCDMLGKDGRPTIEHDGEHDG